MKGAWNKIYQELCEWRNMGVQLLLEGRESDPDHIARALRVAEKGAYMRDYIPDESGERLEAIGFNRVIRRRVRPELWTAGRTAQKAPGESAGERRQTDQKYNRTRSGK